MAQLDRNKMLTVWLNDAEMSQIKTLADDIDASVAYLVRGWLKAAWAERRARESARAWSNGTPVEELDGETA